MLDAVYEFTQQKAQERLAMLAQEYDAAKKQWGHTLSAVDRLKLERQMENTLAEMHGIQFRMRQPWHIHLARIDYSRAYQGLRTRQHPPTTAGRRCSVDAPGL